MMVTVLTVATLTHLKWEVFTHRLRAEAPSMMRMGLTVIQIVGL